MAKNTATHTDATDTASVDTNTTNTTNTTNLNITADALAELNTALEQAQKNASPCWYEEQLRGASKALNFSEKARQALVDAGVNVEKHYYSYNTSPSVYKALLAVFEANSDIFTRRVKA